MKTDAQLKEDIAKELEWESAAAGIDHFPADQLERFVAAFSVAQWGSAPIGLVSPSG